MTVNPASLLASVPSDPERLSGAGPKSKIGLIAGWGRYPIVVAEALQAARMAGQSR